MTQTLMEAHMLLRGRVKVFWSDKGYGWLEIPGHADHFIHIKQRRSVQLHVNGPLFNPAERERLPKEGDWVMFRSGKLPDKDQPQAMPWSFVSDVTVSEGWINQLWDSLRSLGLA